MDNQRHKDFLYPKPEHDIISVRVAEFNTIIWIFVILTAKFNRKVLFAQKLQKYLRFFTSTNGNSIGNKRWWNPVLVVTWDKTNINSVFYWVPFCRGPTWREISFCLVSVSCESQDEEIKYSLFWTFVISMLINWFFFFSLEFRLEEKICFILILCFQWCKMKQFRLLDLHIKVPIEVHWVCLIFKVAIWFVCLREA